MKISKKCQYALKAIFELAWRNGAKAVKTREIADAQRMSARFTEIILNELRHGGFVESRRGNEGGFLLARDSRELTIREIIEYVEGPISFAPEGVSTAFVGNEAFRGLWREVNNAVYEVCDEKTFADLVKFERAKRSNCVPNYNI
ncbi:MAG: RrF2 family transcriptional regulator [Planctomycetota bacterium]|jgi:Rrf2 family protein